jgi:hypothetical protein
MNDLLNKLNYKGQQRITVINADENFIKSISKELNNVQIDKEIDQRYLYEFMLLFVKSRSEVNQLALIALHNLSSDGILWFCYPKKTSKKYSSDLERDHGWEVLSDSGFHGIRMVAIDEDWSAMRFRNIKFIRSTSERFTK